jgi:hypothetical protein
MFSRAPIFKSNPRREKSVGEKFTSKIRFHIARRKFSLTKIKVGKIEL